MRTLIVPTLPELLAQISQLSNYVRKWFNLEAFSETLNGQFSFTIDYCKFTYEIHLETLV